MPEGLAAGAEVAPGIDRNPSKSHGAPDLGAEVMYRMAGQWVDVRHTSPAGQQGGGQHPVARPFYHPLPAWMAMV